MNKKRIDRETLTLIEEVEKGLSTFRGIRFLWANQVANHRISAHSDATIDPDILADEQSSRLWRVIGYALKLHRKLWPHGNLPVQGMALIQVGAKLFPFDSFDEWVNDGRVKFENSGVEFTDIVYIDAHGRICAIGKHFKRAEKEDAYPVTAYHIDPAFDDETMWEMERQDRLYYAVYNKVMKGKRIFGKPNKRFTFPASVFYECKCDKLKLIVDLSPGYDNE